MYPSETNVYSLLLSHSGAPKKKTRQNLNIIMYMNSAEKNQQRCCVQSMNVENLRGYRVSFCFSLYSTDSRRTYIQPIHHSTEGIRWHSIADGINIKKLYTFLHTSARWLCTHFYHCLSFCACVSQIESCHY